MIERKPAEVAMDDAERTDRHRLRRQRTGCAGLRSAHDRQEDGTGHRHPRGRLAPDPTDEEIVVCAAAPEREARSRLRRPRSPVDRFSDALTFKLGGIELGLIRKADGQRALGVRTEF
jgi:hypothetical protein